MNKTAAVSVQDLDRLSFQAKQLSRLRKNFNFHPSSRDICLRLLNAMEPDSYIQPHRHLDVHQDETLIAIRGRMGLIIFDDDGNIEEKAILEPNGDVAVVNIPHGKYHTLLSLEENGVFFEAKAGPYKPLTQDEKPSWAPGEGDLSAHEYLEFLKKMLSDHEPQG